MGALLLEKCQLYNNERYKPEKKTKNSIKVSQQFELNAM